MKGDKLIGVLAGAIVLTGVGGMGYVVAQTFNNARESLLSVSSKVQLKTNQSTPKTTNETEFKMNPLTPEEEAKQWQETKQKLAEVGINLTPQQETTIRQAQRKLSNEMIELFQDNPLVTLGQLIAASSLPPKQGEDMMKVTGLDQRLGNPLLAYRNSVLAALTPEQRPIWDKHFWNREGQARSTENNFQITSDAPDPAEQARQWEETKQRFRAAGVPLTPQQETQMQAANSKLQADLNQEFQANPTGTFARFFAVAVLPEAITERFADTLMGQSLIAHFQEVNQILTPEQQKVWERSFSNQG